MIPSQLKQALPILIEQRRAVMLWGAPGIFKSAIVEEVGRDMGRRVVDFRLAMRDPTALQGFPMPDRETKTMHFYRDTELPTDGTGILFLDEIVNAPQATQLAAMQLTLTGRIGDYVLPDGWSIVAAGNRESDRTAVHRMPTALSLRFIHIDCEVSLDDWCDWAVDNSVHSDVIAFIRFRTDLLHKFDPNLRSSPNPRSWQFVDEIYKQDLNADIEFELIKGTVGEGPAGEFVAFVDQIRNLPTFEQIQFAPDKVEVPESPATLYALSTMLGMKVSGGNYNNTMQYVNRLPVEFQVLFNRDAVRRDQSVCREKSFVDWSIKHAKVMV